MNICTQVPIIKTVSITSYCMNICTPILILKHLLTYISKNAFLIKDKLNFTGSPGQRKLNINIQNSENQDCVVCQHNHILL